VTLLTQGADRHRMWQASQVTIATVPSS